MLLERAMRGPVTDSTRGGNATPALRFTRGYSDNASRAGPEARRGLRLPWYE